MRLISVTACISTKALRISANDPILSGSKPAVSMIHDRIGYSPDPQMISSFYTTPWAIIASATLTKPAMLAPITRLAGCPYSAAVLEAAA